MADLRSAVLVVLARHGEGYGNEIVDWMREDLGIDLVFTQAKVYPVLRQLEDEDLLTTRKGEPLAERGNRPRIYYRLTDKGHREAVDARGQLDGSTTGLIAKPILLADLSTWANGCPCVADLILDFEA